MLKAATEFLADFIDGLIYIAGCILLGVGCMLLLMAGIAVIESLGIWSLMGLQLLASELGCAWFLELTSKVVVDGEITYLMAGPRFIVSGTVLGLVEMLLLAWYVWRRLGRRRKAGKKT